MIIAIAFLEGFCTWFVVAFALLCCVYPPDDLRTAAGIGLTLLGIALACNSLRRTLHRSQT